MPTDPIRQSSLCQRLAGILLVTLTGTAPLVAQELKNRDFEEDAAPVVVDETTRSSIIGEVANGWKDESSWAHVEVEYSVPKGEGRNKTSAQKIEVKSVSDGVVQFAQDLQLEAGSYRFVAWVRSEEPAQATLMVRQAGPPYAAYGRVMADLTSEWKEVEFPVEVPEAGVCFVMLNPEGPGTYLLDDVTLEPAK